MAGVSFRPVNLGRWTVWTATALLLLLLPMLFRGGFAITMLSQMGIFVIFALAYNMIFGQGGMLSFGHAVYSGLGAYLAVHALNAMTAAGGAWATPLTVALLPLVGGVAGAFFGVVFGFLTTRKAGTPFAMITLGIGEMVHSASLMFPEFFGGEGGVSTNRVVGDPIAGISFGPAIEVYYLIAAWCLLSMALMFAFSRTPLGRISNAVRDNPERVEFIGYSARRVRFLVLIASAFFAGIAGALAAINFELVTAENVSALQSGGVLLATFIGGAAFFFGPILGAVIFVFFSVALSDYTKAWQFYLGLFFVLMVMYAPGGVAALVAHNLRVLRHGLLGRLRGAYAAVLLAASALILVLIVFIELAYHRALESSGGTMKTVFGIPFETGSLVTWAGVIAALVVAGFAFDRTRRRFAVGWGQVQEEIEAIESGRRAT
jgi:branched-chain amino acid transport system permease protein